MRKLSFPRGSLVVLIGASGSGKSTFARRHFRQTQIVSSDVCRGLISDDIHNYTCSEDAFQLLYAIVRLRLKRQLTTVIDSTAVDQITRDRLMAIAREFSTPTVVILFDVPIETCVERDATRPVPVGREVIERQRQMFDDACAKLTEEGWKQVVELVPETQARVRLAVG
jgi:predicted kinase